MTSSSVWARFLYTAFALKMPPTTTTTTTTTTPSSPGNRSDSPPEPIPKKPLYDERQQPQPISLPDTKTEASSPQKKKEENLHAMCISADDLKHLQSFRIVSDHKEGWTEDTNGQPKTEVYPPGTRASVPARIRRFNNQNSVGQSFGGPSTTSINNESPDQPTPPPPQPPPPSQPAPPPMIVSVKHENVIVDDATNARNGLYGLSTLNVSSTTTSKLFSSQLASSSVVAEPHPNIAAVNAIHQTLGRSPHRLVDLPPLLNGPVSSTTPSQPQSIMFPAGSLFHTQYGELQGFKLQPANQSQPNSGGLLGAPNQTNQQQQQQQQQQTQLLIQSTVGGGGSITQQQIDAQRKRELRLQKNREAARECRRKKKEYIKCLEARVAVLENQNKSLLEENKTLKDQAAAAAAASGNNMLGQPSLKLEPMLHHDDDQHHRQRRQ